MQPPIEGKRLRSPPLAWVMFAKTPRENLSDLHPRRDAQSLSGVDREMNP